MLVRSLGIVALALYSAGVCAAESRVFEFDGFGTLGVVHSDEDQADFVSDDRQIKGAGFTNSWSATPDSKVGLQLTGTFTDRFSAVVQLVSQYQYDGSFTPYVEWANVKFQVTPDFNIRVGRTAIPTFMFSDSLNVGYALPYMRIPIEIYAQLPNTNSDGIDGSYRFHVGAVTNTVQLFVGGFDSRTPGGGFYNVRDLRGIADTMEFGAVTLHISYQKMSYDLYDLRIATAGYASTSPQTIAALGATYDPGKWYVSGEWIRSSDDASGLFHAGYIIGGYRINTLTPYLGHARTHMVEAGPFGQPFIEQNTTTLGLRWDFTNQWDLKLQLDHTNRDGGINAYFVNQQPGFEATGTLNTLSIAVNFVF